MALTHNARLTSLLLALCFTTATIQGCKSTIANAPTEAERLTGYTRLHASARAGYALTALRILADTVEAVLDGAVVLGFDQVFRNWQAIQTGAQIDMVSRAILASRMVQEGVARDSGLITFRLHDSTQAIGFRDSTMTFVTYWAPQGSTKDWRIILDSIRPQVTK